MPISNTISTRFLIMSDTHGIPPLTPAQDDSAYRLPFPKVDVLLHCGDISNFGNASEYAPVLAALKAADAELKIVIAGNHDLTLDEDFIKRKIGWDTADQAMVERARKTWTGSDARLNGIRYLEEGLHKFTLKNGATFTIYASPYTPGLPDWAFPYHRHEDRFNPSLLEPPTSPSKNSGRNSSHQPKSPIPCYPLVDIILTHGPPNGILDSTLDGTAVGCEHLRLALQRAKPKLHCFGHIHEGWGAEIWRWHKGGGKGSKVSVGDKGQLLTERSAYMDGRMLKPGQETLCINAAILDMDHLPRNAPWVVDLALDMDEKIVEIESQPRKRKRSNEREDRKLARDTAEEDGRRKKTKTIEVESPEVVPILSYP